MKLLLFIAGAIVLLGLVAFAGRHRHGHTIPTVIISAEPSPAAMPTGLPIGRP